MLKMWDFKAYNLIMMINTCHEDDPQKAYADGFTFKMYGIRVNYFTTSYTL